MWLKRGSFRVVIRVAKNKQFKVGISVVKKRQF